MGPSSLSSHLPLTPPLPILAASARLLTFWLCTLLWLPADHLDWNGTPAWPLVLSRIHLQLSSVHLSLVSLSNHLPTWCWAPDPKFSFGHVARTLSRLTPDHHEGWLDNVSQQWAPNIKEPLLPRLVFLWQDHFSEGCGLVATYCVPWPCSWFSWMGTGIKAKSQAWAGWGKQRGRNVSFLRWATSALH